MILNNFVCSFVSFAYIYYIIVVIVYYHYSLVIVYYYYYYIIILLLLLFCCAAVILDQCKILVYVNPLKGLVHCPHLSFSFIYRGEKNKINELIILINKRCFIRTQSWSCIAHSYVFEKCKECNNVI